MFELQQGGGEGEGRGYLLFARRIRCAVIEIMIYSRVVNAGGNRERREILYFRDVI